MFRRGERGPGLPGQKLSSGQFLAANARSASGGPWGGFLGEGFELGDVEGGEVLGEEGFGGGVGGHDRDGCGSRRHGEGPPCGAFIAHRRRGQEEWCAMNAHPTACYSSLFRVRRAPEMFR